MKSEQPVGVVTGIKGPIVVAAIQPSVCDLMVNEVVYVGDDRLIGETSSISEEKATIQVYEDTTGLEKGAPLYRTRELLSVQLGPGLLGSVYDGLQRPLERIAEKVGSYVRSGVRPGRLPKEAIWEFTAAVEKGARVEGGTILGTIRENELIEHKVMVPPGTHGTITNLVEKELYSVDDVVCTVGQGGREEGIKLTQSWPVRTPRPCKRKLLPDRPLLTGQRILDTFFCAAKGGRTAVAGGFGTGKTVLLHQIARFADADIVVYVGCGERGNEIADLLEWFPRLEDPRTGFPLMKRSVIVANTSNMPVAAREASIYTGAAIAEYYRDMGYDVALLVDSTTRWAEALREISTGQGEMPGEEGYPPRMASRLAEFYERAGRVVTLGPGGETGSLTIIASVSPTGGDFSEPVTQKTLQLTRCFWPLDPALAYKRQFPAVNVTQGFSGYVENVESFWHEKVGPSWSQVRQSALNLLAQKSELERIVRLLGMGALTEKEKLVLRDAELLEEAFLKQSAYSDVDAYCGPSKQARMIELIMFLHKTSLEAVEKGLLSKAIVSIPVREEIMELKLSPEEDVLEKYWNLQVRIEAQITRRVREYT